MVLKQITRENYEAILQLKVAKGQETYVSTVTHSLAQAWVYNESAYPFAIYEENEPIGFVMLGYYEMKQQYTLWKFLIDERYQNRGYGKEALRLAISWLKDTFHVKEVYTGVAFGNVVAEHLYESMGFRRTGEADETALEMKYIV